LEKEKYWRGVLSRYRRSKLGKTDFCRQENVNLKSLQNWERIIRQRDREEAASKRRERRRLKKIEFAEKIEETNGSHDFVGVRIKNGKDGPTEYGDITNFCKPGVLIVRLPSHLDADAIIAVLQALQ
jgi:hypothetical protein